MEPSASVAALEINAETEKPRTPGGRKEKTP
jgi:hypothetical protein